jgi:GNAT superfamily N-acetyltransferase
LADALAVAAEDYAREHGAERMKLWSDTRFDRAHRFYEKRGYVRAGPIRVLGDKSNSLEFAYAKPLAGIAVQTLDAAAAASAEWALSRILKAVVEGGASVSFMAPLAPEQAREFWRRVASDVASGKRILLVAWVEGKLVGCVTLNLDLPPNQPHRAEVQKLLVLRSTRRRGIARLLMQRAEQEANRAGRRLLTLDTVPGRAAEALYRSLGWQEVGRVPGFALDPDGTPCDTMFFWKSV